MTLKISAMGSYSSDPGIGANRRNLNRSHRSSREVHWQRRAHDMTHVSLASMPGYSSSKVGSSAPDHSRADRVGSAGSPKSAAEHEIGQQLFRHLALASLAYSRGKYMARLSRTNVSPLIKVSSLPTSRFAQTFRSIVLLASRFAASRAAATDAATLSVSLSSDTSTSGRLTLRGLAVDAGRVACLFDPLSLLVSSFRLTAPDPPTRAVR